MASIVGKKQGNKTYYYLVESARVGGKPRIVSQRYLGPAEEIVARLAEAGPGEPDRTRHLAFGDVAAVWSVLERLKVAEISRRGGGAPAGRCLGVGRDLHRPGHPQPGLRPLLQAGLCRLVGQDRGRPLGARYPPRPSTTGAFGRRWTPSARPS